MNIINQLRDYRRKQTEFKFKEKKRDRWIV